MSHTWDNPGTGQVHNRGVFDAPPTTQPEDLATGSRSTPSQPGDSTGVLQRYGPLVARILICQVFLLSGVMKIVDWSGTEAEMAGRGMFWIPFFLAAATAVELGGGLSLLLGFWGRLGALVLFLYLIPVTLTFHTWWTYPPEQQKVQMLFFLHNLTLMGGLLLVMSCGTGPISLDRAGRRSP